MSRSTVTIPARFRGPPTSVNGGYACGVLARGIAGPSEVTLRAPPPIDKPLTLERGDGVVTLHDGETLVADAARAEVDLLAPPPVSWDEAQRAAAPLAGHMLPSCFVCGPDRAAGDGLRLFPQPIADKGVIAAPFMPDPADCQDGVVPTEIVWSVLDCPSGLPLWLTGGWAGKQGLLGRLAGRIEAPLRAGHRYVAIGWITGQEGRKGFTRSAIVDEGGQVVAAARATWIQLRAT